MTNQRITTWMRCIHHVKKKTVHGWPSKYTKYKHGFDEKAFQYYKTIDGKSISESYPIN